MKKEILTIGVVIVFVAVGFSGCLNESTVTSLAKQMEDTYNSISNYRTIVNYTTQSGYAEQYIKTVKRPDKLKHEYVLPERKQGDMRIINGYTEWDYDKSGNRAFEATCSINIGEERLESPDFLNMLLFLMDNADIEILDDEILDGINTTVLQINFNEVTSLYRWKFWLNKETLFPVKFEVLDPDETVRYGEILINTEANVDISDSEFLLPEGTEIISIGEMELPETLEEFENFTGWKILFPTYLPEAYSLKNYSWIYQVNGMVDTVRIMYPRGIDLQEAVEDIWGEEYGPKTNGIKVDINSIQGEYWIDRDTGQYGEVVYERACLSWSMSEYWLILTAGGEALLDSDEMVKIAESINI